MKKSEDKRSLGRYKQRCEDKKFENVSIT